MEYTMEQTEEPQATVPTGMALRLNRRLTFDEFDYELRKLWKVRDVVGFYIGDLLNFAEDQLGEAYAQLISMTNYDPGTLQNMKWVAGKVRPNGRCEELSWSHHVAVAPLHPKLQDAYLKTAITNDFSVSELKAVIKEGEGDNEVKEKPIKLIDVTCPECDCQFKLEV